MAVFSNIGFSDIFEASYMHIADQETFASFYNEFNTRAGMF